MGEMVMLSERQRRGLDRLGDVLCPGDVKLPSFSESLVAKGASQVLQYMYPADRDALLQVLDVCASTPKPALHGIFSGTNYAELLPEPFGGTVRIASVGLRGFIYALYYGSAQESIMDGIGWTATVVERPDEPDLSRP